MNRNMTEIGWAALPAERRRETAHRYMLGLYELIERMTSEFPHASAVSNHQMQCTVSLEICCDVYGGDELMHAGINLPPLHGDFQSLLWRFIVKE